jgi:hypothetical protein
MLQATGSIEENQKLILESLGYSCKYLPWLTINVLLMKHWSQFHSKHRIIE